MRLFLGGFSWFIRIWICFCVSGFSYAAGDVVEIPPSTKRKLAPIFSSAKRLKDSSPSSTVCTSPARNASMDSESSDNSDEEGDAKKGPPREYTLMLLDRTLVDPQLTIGKAPFWQFVIPKIQEMTSESEDIFESSEIEGGWICRLKRPDKKSRTEIFIEELMGGKDKDTETSDGGLPKNFLAAMILFPIEGNEDKFLAYVFGRWLSLLNVDSIVKKFGLRTAIKEDVFCRKGDIENLELRALSYVESENIREGDIINCRLRSRKGIYPLSSFKLVEGESRLESIRFKPQEKWGRALIEAEDSIKFRMPLSEPISGLKERATLFFKVFKSSHQSNIYQQFIPYIDLPVDRKTVDSLNEKLLKEWPTYFPSDKLRESIVYPHWTYWFRVRNLEDQLVLYKFRGKKDFKGDETINIGGSNIKILNLIRTHPIELESKYYWYDRGEWYEILENTIKLMRNELESNKHGGRLDYDSMGFIPYDEENILKSIMSKKGDGDYKEIIYNKALYNHLRENFPASKVTFMDTTDTYMSGSNDKFEFCDILFQDKEGKYYLVHIKRAGSNSLEYVCTQAERSAMYLSTRFDRSALEHSFMRAEFKVLEGLDFDSKKIEFSWDGGDVASTDDAFKKQLKERILIKKTLKKSVSEPPIYGKLRSFVDNDSFAVTFWRRHPKILPKLFEKISTLKIEGTCFKESAIKLHNAAKTGIENSLFFTKDKIFEVKNRSKIKIVVAIIDDEKDDHGKTKGFTLKGVGDTERTNRILRLHQARKVICDRHFDFRWVTIPKKSDVPPPSLEEYSYQSGDISNLMKTQFPLLGIFDKLPKITHCINIGDKKTPLYVDCYISQKEDKLPRRLILPAIHVEFGGRETTYFSKVLQALTNNHGISQKGKAIYFPYEAQKNFWVIIKLNIPSDSKDKIVPHVLHGKHPNIAKFKNSCNERIIKIYEDLAGKVKSKDTSAIDITWEESLKGDQASDSGPIVVQKLFSLLGATIDEFPDPAAAKKDHFALLQKKGLNFSKPFKEDGAQIVLVNKDDVSSKHGEIFRNRQSKKGVKEPIHERPSKYGYGESKESEEEFGSDLDRAKARSKKEAERAERIGPRAIPGWRLQDVEDRGNCFYDAVVLQLKIHNHLPDIPEGTKPRDDLRDALRLRVQGEDFRDQEWADDKAMREFAKKFPQCALALVDTRSPNNGFFRCIFFDERTGEVREALSSDVSVSVPVGKKILRIAATGNHFMSVEMHPALTKGLIRDAWAKPVS